MFALSDVYPSSALSEEISNHTETAARVREIVSKQEEE